MKFRFFSLIVLTFMRPKADKQIVVRINATLIAERLLSILLLLYHCFNKRFALRKKRSSTSAPPAKKRSLHRFCNIFYYILDFVRESGSGLKIQDFNHQFFHRLFLPLFFIAPNQIAYGCVIQTINPRTYLPQSYSPSTRRISSASALSLRRSVEVLFLRRCSLPITRISFS